VSRPGRFLTPGKTRYPLYRRLGGPQGRSGQVRKISPSPGFDPGTAYWWTITGVDGVKLKLLSARFIAGVTSQNFWRWVQSLPPKRWYISTRLHGVMSLKTGISNHAYPCIKLRRSRQAVTTQRSCLLKSSHWGSCGAPVRGFAVQVLTRCTVQGRHLSLVLLPLPMQLGSVLHTAVPPRRLICDALLRMFIATAFHIDHSAPTPFSGVLFLIGPWLSRLASR